MSKLVFDAIGKYNHPTRYNYRQNVETESLGQLPSEEQQILNTALLFPKFTIIKNGDRAMLL